MGIPVRLTGGATAVILWDSINGDKPIIGAYASKDNGWIPIAWTKDGKYIENVTTLLDIVEDDKKEIQKAPF